MEKNFFFSDQTPIDCTILEIFKRFYSQIITITSRNLIWKFCREYHKNSTTIDIDKVKRSFL